jgi:hypothetical protein
MPFATPQQPQSLEAVLQHVVFEPQSNPPPQLIVGEDVGGCVGGSERNNNTAAACVALACVTLMSPETFAVDATRVASAEAPPIVVTAIVSTTKRRAMRGESDFLVLASCDTCHLFTYFFN